ncbi:MAG: SRPBCC family protein [Acidimicrobiia bacterium]
MDHDNLDLSTIPASGPGVRSLVKTTTLATDPPTAWSDWASQAGLTAWWNVSGSNIDLRVGGPFELYFDPDAEPGLQGSEGCRYLGYVPGEMISFTWNAPPHLPLRTQNTWVVITFTEAETGTDVRLVHTGFLDGDEWDDYMAYFDRAWGFVLDLHHDYRS